MGLLSAGDIADLKTLMDDVIGDNGESITITRTENGARSTLDPQTVRVERTSGRGSRRSADGLMGERQGDLIIVGDTDLDIRVGDEFPLDGRACVVTFVRPNKQVCIQAEAVYKQ